MGDTPEQSTRQFRDVFVSHPQPRGRSVLLLVLLVVSAAVLMSSMLLPWHHRFVPGHGFRTINNPYGPNWVVALVVALIGIVARLALRPIGSLLVFFIAALAFFGCLGIATDYIDSNSDAAQVQVQAYFGPGFYLALAGTAGLLSAGVLAWRERP